jgi:hypothetical protein
LLQQVAALAAISAGAVLVDRYHPSIEHPVNLSLVDQHRSAPGARPATKPAVNDDSVARRDELNPPSAEIAEGILPSLEQRQHGVDTYVGGGLSCHVALDPRVEGSFHGRAIAALPIAHKISHYGHVLLHRGRRYLRAYKAGAKTWPRRLKISLTVGPKEGSRSQFVGGHEGQV